MNQRNTAIRLSLMIVMTALTAVGTLLIRIPNPMGGYFNMGDVMIFVSALTFGPIIGGFAGGLGSAIADMIGFPLFAIPTLIIKGLEGLIAGFLTNKKHIYRDILAVITAGFEMVAGYFIVEYLILQWGLVPALSEIPANIAQIAVGGIIGIPIAYLLRRRLPENLTT
ncbi:MAG: ECF transporter S component [Candidatus Lokiarchaeota archaeon]|nr:ECF transporter S component [Candidatus Bathyarchaeota archaeon]MBY9012788.1 ECF transporter S component [Candidatus Lokiarchaeota archaeon]